MRCYIVNREIEKKVTLFLRAMPVQLPVRIVRWGLAGDFEAFFDRIKL